MLSLLAVIPAAAALGIIESWGVIQRLRSLYELSFTTPMARFLPLTVQVLLPVWLGTPRSSQDSVSAALRLPRPAGGWPLEASILLLALVLAVLYGAEYGYRLSAAQAAQAERTGESQQSCLAEEATLADRGRDRRNAAGDQAESSRDREATGREYEALVQALRTFGYELENF